MLKKIGLTLLALLFSIHCFGASSLYLLKKKKLAIVIDDMGYNIELTHKLESLGLPLAFSFLPYAPYAHDLSIEASKKGFVVMIHMPSQPEDYPKDNPGSDAIFLWTSKEETFKRLEEAYKIIPTALGLNNHMGSAILRDPKHLDYIMEFLKEHNLFFVDSATVKDSLGCVEAQKFTVPCARRRVFLDDIKQVAYIKGQIRLALRMLKRYNNVLAIGHCNEKTYEALYEMRERLKKYMVPVIFVLR